MMEVQAVAPISAAISLKSLKGPETFPFTCFTLTGKLLTNCIHLLKYFAVQYLFKQAFIRKLTITPISPAVSCLKKPLTIPVEDPIDKWLETFYKHFFPCQALYCNMPWP